MRRILLAAALCCVPFTSNAAMFTCDTPNGVEKSMNIALATVGYPDVTFASRLEEAGVQCEITGEPLFFIRTVGGFARTDGVVYRITEFMNSRGSSYYSFERVDAGV